MSYALVQSIMTTLAIVLIILIMCYFGQTVTDDCETIANSVYNELWYRFPIKLQKSMIIIIQRSQHSYIFTAYKMYRCTLRSFTGVSIFHNDKYIYTFTMRNKLNIHCLIGIIILYVSLQIINTSFQICMLFRTLSLKEN